MKICMILASLFAIMLKYVSKIWLLDVGRGWQEADVLANLNFIP